MIFMFRVCDDNDQKDSAQGWVVAVSEMDARALVGPNASFHQMRNIAAITAPNGTVFVTSGKLQ